MFQLKASLVSLPSQAAKELSLEYYLASLLQGPEELLVILRKGNGWEQGRQRESEGTLKSDSEAMSSSSSLVAEEAEMRVCCWLEVTRCGLLISPWFTVIAGLWGRHGVSKEPKGQPQAPRGGLQINDTSNSREGHQNPAAP